MRMGILLEIARVRLVARIIGPVLTFVSYRVSGATLAHLPVANGGALDDTGLLR
jgi:hypothetical protein